MANFTRTLLLATILVATLLAQAQAGGGGLTLGRGKLGLISNSKEAPDIPVSPNPNLEIRSMTTSSSCDDHQCGAPSFADLDPHLELEAHELAALHGLGLEEDATGGVNITDALFSAPKKPSLFDRLLGGGAKSPAAEQKTPAEEEVPVVGQKRRSLFDKLFSPAASEEPEEEKTDVPPEPQFTRGGTSARFLGKGAEQQERRSSLFNKLLSGFRPEAEAPAGSEAEEELRFTKEGGTSARFLAKRGSASAPQGPQAVNLMKKKRHEEL